MRLLVQEDRAFVAETLEAELAVVAAYAAGVGVRARENGRKA